jgi:hypothetical protein
MNRNLSALALVSALSVAGTAAAQTENFSNKEGTLGLGVDHGIANGALGGTAPALSIRYMLTDALGIEAMLGGNMAGEREQSDAGDLRASSSQFDISLLAEYRIGTSRQATLSAYGGVGLSLVGTGVGGDSPERPDEFVGSYTDIAFELGLRGEVFLTKHFSVFMRAGINIDPTSDRESEFRAGPGGRGGAEDPDVKTTASAIGIFRGDLLGRAGFTFWF